MNVRFQDLEEHDNPRNGERFADTHELVALLEQLRRSRSPFMCELVGDNGTTLTVGIGGDNGCVQHARGDGTPPYLMALMPPEGQSVLHEMEFLVGGTPTPIEGRYCLPFGKLAEIVAEFAASGKRSDAVNWEEF
jgi:hypothetical protein